ncbi:MAG: GNAT family N-acetyltransferase [Ignavibacteria bacterium]|nr:GNAT family N-acetyltransferase [Ignavibacteria bacterium]
MYIIKSVKYNTESEWHEYFEMSQELNKKHYPDRFNENETLNNFIAQILDSYNKTKGYDNYLIKREGLPVGWFYTTTWGDVFYVGLYVNAEVIKNDLFKEVLTYVYRMMKKMKYDVLFTSSYRKANIDWFLKLNAEITEEFISSQLVRSDINVSELTGIINNFSMCGSELIYAKKIEDRFFDSYLECFNLSFIDLMNLNKIALKYEPFTKEQLISNQNSGSDKRIILLLDTANNVLGFSELYYIKERKMFSCDSGFTAVHPAYRGKGIAKYLKASLCSRLLSEDAEFDRITTNTLKYNNFMNKINLDLGFKEYRRGYSFRLTKEFIEKNLRNIE